MSSDYYKGCESLPATSYPDVGMHGNVQGNNVQGNNHFPLT